MKALVASRRRVVPVSTMPEVELRTDVEPYDTDRSMPQYSEAGDIEVTMGAYVSSPVYLLESVPPKSSEPLDALAVEDGAYEMPMVSEGIVPWLNRSSVMVGTELEPTMVLLVRSTRRVPKMPSTSEKPIAVLATPMLWFVMARSEARVTVSVYSVPLKDPLP